MPSGAKKRKAAKKRKETHPNSNRDPSAAHTQGGDDGQSDVGEVSARSSVASHYDLLTEGEEEKVEKVERELKIEHEFDKKNGSSRSSSDDESRSVEINHSLHEENVNSTVGEVGNSWKKGSIEVQETFVDAVSNLDETNTPSVKKITTSFDSKTSVMEETDDQLSLPYITPVATLDTEKDSGVTEPLLVPVERATWKSCCGICELFTGSGR